MIKTHCPLGGPDEADIEVWPANFDPDALDERIFSARRRPDRIHYRMVRNSVTGLLRADPILDETTIMDLYRKSTVTYDAISELTTSAYLEHMAQVWQKLPDKRGALEIGCGPGSFLNKMHERGFKLVQGIEPSLDAIEKAAPAIKSAIFPGVFSDNLFPPESFSLICGFQVLDHLTDPNSLLTQCRRLLSPRGVMYWICHDEGLLPARALGQRSPIVDIEHPVLYNKKTVRRLFENNGYCVLSVSGVRNRYPLGYWLHLTPIPSLFKNMLIQFFHRTGLERILVKINLGNMAVVAQKLDV